MKIAVYSDLHLEFHDNQNTRDGSLLRLLSRLPQGVDAIVFAGDVDNHTRIPHVLGLATDFANHVLFVSGNHELYGCRNAPDSINKMEDAIAKINNAHYLNNNTIELNGQRFLGSTMWFTQHSLDDIYQKKCRDFTNIPEFSDLVGMWNSESIAFFEKELAPNDVVITHHAPSALCINDNYSDQLKEYGVFLGRFYYCNMDKLIVERKPQYWIHGHIHMPVSLTLNKTQIESNPVGYPMDRQNQNTKILKVLYV